MFLKLRTILLMKFHKIRIIILLMRLLIKVKELEIFHQFRVLMIVIIKRVIIALDIYNQMIILVLW